MTARSTLQDATDVALIVIARLAGGPTESTRATARWAAQRVEGMGPDVTPETMSSLSIVCADGERVTGRGHGMIACLEALVNALATPERYAAAKAREAALEEDHCVELVDPGSFVDPEEPAS